MFIQFGKDYAGAQSSIEWAEFAGGGLFEIVLTALLLAFTGGLGNAAQIASKIRHAARLRTLGGMLRKLGKLLQRKKLSKKTKGGVDSKHKVQADKPEGQKLSSGDKDTSDKKSDGATSKPGDFPNRLTSDLTDDAASIISGSTKGQLRRQAALSRAGVDELGIVSNNYTNLPGSVKDFPGVRRLDDEFFVIDDQAAYIKQVEILYANSGNTLNSATRARILEHIGDGSKKFPTQAGIPGLHAEVQSVNSVINQVPAGFDLSKINVSTIKLAPGHGQGLAFPACSNCGGILSNSVNILTGVK